jgi:hypothetical protein
MNRFLDIKPEVREAIEAGKPVVALESTIISHGMPYPQNVETALAVEKIVRENGAVPATIAIIGGRLKAGLTPEEIEQKKATILYQANDQGAILVSPCISPGEQQIATAALTEHIPLIVLLLKGFSPFFKPQPKYLEACTEGRLLMLSPYPWQNEKITNMRQRCLQLNDIAAEICKLSNEG